MHARAKAPTPGRPGVRAAAAILSFAALLASCAVGPDFKRPSTDAGDSFTRTPLPETTAAAPVDAGAAQRLAFGQDIPAAWWTVFHSDGLDKLVRQAYAANPNVRSAQAALRQAQQLLAAQRGAYFPSADIGFAPTRQKNAVGTLAPTLNSGQPIFNLYTAQLSVGYTLDVFGANRRQVESLQAQAEQQRFLLEATYLTLGANVVATAIQEASLRAQIDVTDRIYRIEFEQLDILRRENDLGAIAATDVAAQEAVAAQTAASLPGLRKQLALTRDQLTALLGRLPRDEPDEVFELARLDLPVDVPVSLPSRLVEQRPDVRAAEAQMRAASAQVGVAIANMLPQLSVAATYGGVSTDIGRIFSPGDVFWTLGANLSQTLFDGGALYHRKQAAWDALDQAGAQYRSTVITAFQNVADTLQALVFDADALKASVDAERAADRSLGYMRKAHELGSVSYLALLNAEQVYQQAVIGRVQAQANRYADTAALFQSLGGGWWNGSEPPADAGGQSN
jgi:NodT family efflux transporter outer membrane factor (OMF) lipoprotein